MTKKRKKVSLLGSGGVGVRHFLRTGSGFHSKRKWTKADRTAGKKATKDGGS